jgi:hypothetical protein
MSLLSGLSCNYAGFFGYSSSGWSENDTCCLSLKVDNRALSIMFTKEECVSYTFFRLKPTKNAPSSWAQHVCTRSFSDWSFQFQAGENSPLIGA